MKVTTLKQRFFAKVAVPTSNDGCWLWTGAADPTGYGRFKVNGRADMAHRFSHELHTGPIPPEYDIDHLCRVTLCVNPEHLEAVTRRVNTNRGLEARGLFTHCPNGHTKDETNTEVTSDGIRLCRECRRRNYRNRYARLKQNPEKYAAYRAAESLRAKARYAKRTE